MQQRHTRMDNQKGATNSTFNTYRTLNGADLTNNAQNDELSELMELKLINRERVTLQGNVIWT
jgi:hypothetical protein